MGWTGGALDGPFTSLAAIAFELGDEFASRVVDTARYGTVIYAAVRSEDGAEVFGLVLLAERSGGVLYTKAISEDMGPAEDCCPERILDLLSEPSDEWAREWRQRCRARIERGRPSRGQAVVFKEPLSFVDGAEHRVLTFVAGSRFRSRDGVLYHVPSWWTLDYELRAEEAEGGALTPEEHRRAEEADERGDYGSLASRIGRLADTRYATARGLEELRRRPGARGSDIRAREEQLRSYERELAELRERAA
jgi:Domain of unknown function (DUF6927)